VRARSFVIHLRRAERRRGNAETLLRTLPFDAQILDAIDAATLPEGEIRAAYGMRLHRPLYPFELRRAEIACFLSHRHAWARIAEGDADAGLIVEDDVEFDRERLDAVLALAKTVFKPEDYLRFPQHLRDESGPVVAQARDVSVIEPRVPGRRMFMQLVGRQAAARLLSFTERFDRPVDALLQMRWLLPVRVLAARPICVREISGALGGTSIQTKTRPVADTLTREIARPLYRLAVQLRAAAARN
jgi:GR25 family glycosyltransferase involved in LPS biosynthesis